MAPDPREIELKFEVRPSEVPALLDHPLIRDARGGRDAGLRSVYFDTWDLALRGAGLTLRVREEAGGHVQTVKAAGAAAVGLFDRSEWERTVPGPDPDVDAAKGTPVRKLLGRRGFAELRPLFTTVVERRIAVLDVAGGRVEVAVDRGRIEAGSRTQELCELELELKDGPSSALFAAARVLAEAVPLRPAVATKSERGYVLALGEADIPVKAATVPLGPALTAAQGFQAIAWGCLRQLRLNEAILLRGSEVEALHQTRVALRRLRSALSLFKAVVADEERDALAAALRRLSEPLGRARNLDVFLGTTLPAEIERHPDEERLRALGARLGAEREEARAAVRAVLESRDWARALFGLVAWIEAGPWLRSGEPAQAARRDAPLRDFAVEALDRRRRQVRRRGRHLAGLDPHDRHEVRIAAKKLRYAAEFFLPVFASSRKAGRRAKAFLGALESLQDHLGDLNDIATAHLLTAEFAGDAGPAPLAFAAGVLAADQDSRSAGLLAAAARAHAAFGEAKPFWR